MFMINSSDNNLVVYYFVTTWKETLFKNNQQVVAVIRVYFKQQDENVLIKADKLKQMMIICIVLSLFNICLTFKICLSRICKLIDGKSSC